LRVITRSGVIRFIRSPWRAGLTRVVDDVFVRVAVHHVAVSVVTRRNVSGFVVMTLWTTDALMILHVLILAADDCVAFCVVTRRVVTAFIFFTWRTRRANMVDDVFVCGTERRRTCSVVARRVVAGVVGRPGGAGGAGVS
jgi:hypothetical protein